MIDDFGVSDGYHDIAGTWHPTTDETRAALHAAMGAPGGQPGLWFVPAGASEPLWSPCRIVLEDGTDLGPHDRLPGDLPVGYHQLRPVDGAPPSTVVVYPERCPDPPRAWGLAAQVYALWSAQSWGIGDLHDVAALAGQAAARGAGVLLLSPLHAPAPTTHQEDSPYSPSSRCWWNPLLLPVAGDPPVELAVTPPRLIDRDTVWAAKRAALWEEYRRAPGGWQGSTAGMGTLGMYATWCALAERHGAAWWTWPAATRRPGSAALAHVRDDPELAAAAEFHRWLQWRLHTELGALGPGRGSLPLIGDLAVGFSPAGYDAWHHQGILASGGVQIGAPPDELAPDGQRWGLPPFVPWRLRAAGYRPLIDVLRATLTGMSGIRIDHVMGLFRQYWALPDGGGAYVHLPAEELLAVVAVEAHRAGAFVIGEDLGTVPPEVAPAMRARGMLGTRVALLDDAPPAVWPEHAVGTLTTHDLPTSAGVLAGDGTVEMRDRLAAAMGQRGAVAAIDLLRAATAHSAAVPGPALRNRLLGALHEALLASPAQIRLLTTDDLCATPLRQNVPGTVGPPNWCRPLPLPIDQIPHPAH